MRIRLEPVNDQNREAVLALSVREDQPFVAPNDVSLRQADEANAEQPGYARPFAIYADERLVGFCMFAFDPEAEEPAGSGSPDDHRILSADYQSIRGSDPGSRQFLHGGSAS